MSTKKILAYYEYDLREWKKRNGLQGGGGKWVRQGKEPHYAFAPEPEIPFAVDSFERKCALAVRLKAIGL
jgi:hypothetical protein